MIEGVDTILLFTIVELPILSARHCKGSVVASSTALCNTFDPTKDKLNPRALHSVLRRNNASGTRYNNLILPRTDPRARDVHTSVLCRNNWLCHNAWVTMFSTGQSDQICTGPAKIM